MKYFVFFLISVSFIINYNMIIKTDKVESETIRNSIKYFGQAPPGIIPKIFAPGFVSTEEFEFSGTFSNDGTEYFFTRRPTYEGRDNRIYYSQLLNGEWTKPKFASFAKDLFEFEPVMVPNEDKIYFFSERKENRDTRYDGDLWVTEKTKVGWSEPSYFLSPVNKKWCMSVSSTLKGTLYFTSNYDSKRGVFKSPNEKGDYIKIDYLPSEINTVYYSHPFIAPDESYIIMDAQVSGRGKPELFISFKNGDNSWTEPINMGATINATKTEFGASVSPDGKYLFFHRRVKGNGDIYWVDAGVIDDLKQLSF